MKTKILISIVCIVGVAVHLIWPAFKIDLITLILVIVGVLPWTASIIKSLELPGGFKIELQDVKAATDKVKSLPMLEAEPGTFVFSGHGAQLLLERADSIASLRDAFGRDPNLALVGVRIEIEKRVNLLCQMNNIDANRPLRYKLQHLQRQKVIPAEVASGLNDLVSMGNKAAHGAEVSPDAASWVLDVGPEIISILDEIISANSAPRPRT